MCFACFNVQATAIVEGETFKSLSEINERLLIWLKEVDSQIHQGTHKIPNEEFKKENTIEAYKNFYINDKIKVKKLAWK